MASSATSATSFELIEDQALTAEEVEISSQEAQEVRTREAAVVAGLVLDEPEAPPSASATDVMNDLSSALERLRVAFSTPTPGLGAQDKEMSDAVTTERATPPTKRLKGFVAASQQVSLVPVDGRPGYFKLVDLPDLFPVLPASAATLLRDVTVEEAVSLFHKFVGKNLTEDLVVRILGRRRSGPHSSSGIRHALGISGCTDLMPATRTTNSCVRHAARGGRRQPINAGSARARSLSPSRHPLLPTRRTASRTTCSLWRASRPGSSSGMGEAWVPLAPVVPGRRQTATWWTARSWGELLRKRTRQRRSPWLTWSRNRRVDIRQEILSMEADALKVRERQEVKVKVQRSLQEAEAQSFQLYHPQVDQAIRKKEELHKALRERREPTPEESSARQRRKELVTDECNPGASPGGHAGPAGRGGGQRGSRALRKVNLEQFKAKLQDQYLEGKGVDASQALADAMGSIQEANKRTSTRHGCLTTPSSP